MLEGCCGYRQIKIAVWKRKLADIAEEQSTPRCSIVRQSKRPGVEPARDPVGQIDAAQPRPIHEIDTIDLVASTAQNRILRTQAAIRNIQYLQRASSIEVGCKIPRAHL